MSQPCSMSEKVLLDDRRGLRMLLWSRGPPFLSTLPRIIHPFSLVIPPTTYCPGSDIQGEVLLEFPQVQDEQIDEVVVEFRGTLRVSTPSSSDRVFTEKHELLCCRKSLWTRGSTYPPPDSNILRLPFRFHLPSGPTTLPSVFWNEWHDFVSIVYHVEATARRPATVFAKDKRIRERLVVVSRGDPSLCTSVRSLGKLEGGLTWKAAHKDQQMRRGLWGEYSTARVEFLIPNEYGILPHCVDIPVLVKIETTTARLSRAKAEQHPEGKPIFPAVAFDANNPIFIDMRQRFSVRATRDSWNSTNNINLVCIKEEDLLPSSSSYCKHWEADIRHGDKVDMGRWVQHWTLQPTLKLNKFPPTFSSDMVDCAYTLLVHVPFPGVGNDVKVSIPVTLDSGIDCATPRKSGGASPAACAMEDVTTSTSTSTSFGAEARAGADAFQASGGARPEIRREERAQSRPPTYFDAVYRDGREGEGAPGPSVPASNVSSQPAS